MTNRSGDETSEPCEPLVNSVCTLLIESMNPKPPPTKNWGCGYRNPKGLGVPSNVSSYKQAIKSVVVNMFGFREPGLWQN